jgi:post-segregation antitoxin (ccd killing protein)
MHPSIEPSLYPTSMPTIEVANADKYVSLSLKLRKFSHADLVAVLVVFACISILLLWIGWRRHEEVLRCIEENLDAKSGSRRVSQGLKDFKASGYVEPLMSFSSLVSNFSQIGYLIADGYIWSAYLIVGTYVITLILSVMVQFTLFQIMCFSRLTDLPLRLHRRALSRNQRLWSSIALLSLYDMFILRLLPWVDNDFCERSGGFPTLGLFVFVHATSLLQNIVITGALTATESLNLLQFLSLVSSLALIVLSLYKLCIKVLYEIISAQVVVVSKEFAERAKTAGIHLSKVMIVDLESEIEAPSTNLDIAADEQQKVNAALDHLLRRRESRESARNLSHSFSKKVRSDEAEFQIPSASETQYAYKTIQILKQQMINDYGGKPLEYIPLSNIKAELEQLMQAARDGTSFDEDRLDHLIRCMEYNDEYIAQKKEEERRWVEDSREVLSKSLEVMRPFVPVNIASMTLAELEVAGLSKALARRIMTKRCLWLIRMSQSDIAKMHVADLTGKYNTEAQNLDVIEMAAIYQWLLGVNFESDAGGKKVKMRGGLKRSLREKMGSLASFDEFVKKRNVVYKNQTGPYMDFDAVYSLEVVSSEDVFSSRASRLSFRGLTRPAFDAASQMMLGNTKRSDIGGTNTETDD